MPRSKSASLLARESRNTDSLNFVPTMLMQRRTFLKTSLAGAGLVALPGAIHLSRAEAPKVTLKLSSQEGRVPGASLKDKVGNLEQWGASAIELGGNAQGRLAEIKEALKGTSIKVSAICWGSHGGDLVSRDKAKQAKGIQDLKDILATAGELAAAGVIFVPCFHKQSDLPPDELDKILLDILPAIGEHAQKAGSRVLLEPLNKNETFYLNRIEQAAAICAKVNHPAICLMGDFYHMGLEEKSDQQAFVTGGKWLHHIHLASRVRWLPGQDKLKEPDQPERSFVDGFRGLKRIGYQDYCSLECGMPKGAKGEECVPAAFDFLRRQWDEATV